MLYLCWSITKRFLSVLVVFGKYFVFAKMVQKFQKLFCPVLATQSRVEPIACPSCKSITEIFHDSLVTPWWVKDLEYFSKIGFSCFSRLRLATCSRVEGPIARGTQRFSQLSSRLSREWNFQSRKTLGNFFQSFLFSVLAAGPGDLHAACLSRENRMFCTNLVSF